MGQPVKVKHSKPCLLSLPLATSQSSSIGVIKDILNQTDLKSILRTVSLFTVSDIGYSPISISIRPTSKSCSCCNSFALAIMISVTTHIVIMLSNSQWINCNRLLQDFFKYSNYTTDHNFSTELVIAYIYNKIIDGKVINYSMLPYFPSIYSGTSLTNN